MTTYHYGTSFGDNRFVPEWKQEVRDAQGRRRFHGAFTGGFSAGYFNSVGSKEGWTPSSFRSSRSNPAKRVRLAPQDFMDEEDLAEVEETKTLQRSNNDDFTSSEAIISVNPTAHDKHSRGSRILDFLDPKGLIKPMPDNLRGRQSNKGTSGLGYETTKMSLPALRSDSRPKSVRSIRNPKTISSATSKSVDEEDDYVIRPSKTKKKPFPRSTTDKRMQKMSDSLPGFVLALSSLSIIPSTEDIPVPNDFKPNPLSRPGNENSKLRKARNVAAKLSNKVIMMPKKSAETKADYEGAESIRQTMANRFVSAKKPNDADDDSIHLTQRPEKSKPLEIGQSRRIVTSFAPAPLVCKRFGLSVPETTQQVQEQERKEKLDQAVFQAQPEKDPVLDESSLPVVSQEVDLFASIFGS